uniref:Uncharacterized protein n=1 Tax=Asterionellopsis glacialis TaxID=33640 RepID=A0A7S0PWL8_9STRA|mmetsp:Transcript_2036/g.2969  ORF Transcript_2036/g.2969 Transcript_2036/m.2969 type:complete len:237 (+) Transcript_2036:96-806(+)
MPSTKTIRLFLLLAFASPIILVDGFTTSPSPLLNNYRRETVSSSPATFTFKNIQLGASEEPLTSATVTTSSSDADPRKALEKFGSLFSQVQAIVLEGGSWDEDTLEQKTEEFLRTYVGVFVPGMGYVITSIGIYLGTFAFLGTALTISGRGYNDLLAAASVFEPLRNFLQDHVDPTWGTIGISLVGLELLSPAIVAATLALTPKTMDTLQSKLNDWGWGEADIDNRVAELLGKKQQ